MRTKEVIQMQLKFIATHFMNMRDLYDKNVMIGTVTSYPEVEYEEDARLRRQRESEGAC